MRKAIVIGAGSSIDRYDHLMMLAKSSFDGVILVCDKVLDICLRMGVRPEKFKNYYVFTLEDFSWVWEWLKNCDCPELISLVHGPRTRKDILERCQAMGYVIKADYWQYLDITSNVGLMAFSYGWRRLKLDEICLIGMDHANYKENVVFGENTEAFNLFYQKYYNPEFDSQCYLNPIQQIWREAFFDYLKLAPKNLKIVNCTQAGSLFGKNIICMDFARYLDGRA